MLDDIKQSSKKQVQNIHKNNEVKNRIESQNLFGFSQITWTAIVVIIVILAVGGILFLNLHIHRGESNKSSSSSSGSNSTSATSNEPLTQINTNDLYKFECVRSDFEILETDLNLYFTANLPSAYSTTSTNVSALQSVNTSIYNQSIASSIAQLDSNDSSAFLAYQNAYNDYEGAINASNSGDYISSASLRVDETSQIQTADNYSNIALQIIQNLGGHDPTLSEISQVCSS